MRKLNVMLTPLTRAMLTPLVPLTGQDVQKSAIEAANDEVANAWRVAA